MENRFLVVVHDVAPVFGVQLRTIVRTLEPLVGNRFSAAVVPRWHGGPSGAADDPYGGLLGCFGERLLHGWTHQRERRNGLISWLTGQADEFQRSTAGSNWRWSCDPSKAASFGAVAVFASSVGEAWAEASAEGSG